MFFWNSPTFLMIQWMLAIRSLVPLPFLNPAQEILGIAGVTGKFGLGVQNEAGQRLTEFCQENTLLIANTLFQEHKR